MVSNKAKAMVVDASSTGGDRSGGGGGRPPQAPTATTTAFASLNAKRVVEGNVVVTEPVSYAREALGFFGVGTEARERRESLARRLAAVGAVLEAEFGTPQLVEGCLVEDEVFVTRTRPRQP